jgi:hypothetical protein
MSGAIELRVGEKKERGSKLKTLPLMCSKLIFMTYSLEVEKILTL